MSDTVAAEPMRELFSKRMREVVDHLARSVDETTIAEVLGMADGFSGLGLAMQRAATTEAAKVLVTL